MRRRECLALLGALPLAGCLADGNPASDGAESDEVEATDRDRTETAIAEPGTTDGTATEDPGEPVATDGLPGVTVRSVTVQRSVIDHHTWREMREPADGQVLVVETASGHDDLSLGLRLDGERVDDAENLAFHGDSRRQVLAVPVRAADDGALVRPSDGSSIYPLPDEAVEQLGSAADFHLHDAEVREGESGTELALTVENTGDSDGTFRGIVVSATASDADEGVRFPVPAGETVTEVVRNDTVGDWDPDDEFIHDVGPDTRRFVVRYV